MPVRKRKPVEANDGSYGGRVLAAFDDISKQPPVGVGSYCPHCENWHEGSCQGIPKDKPLIGIDVPVTSAREEGGCTCEFCND